jgi:GntR family transcriptional repressor for pyruvate dehydrogenase complex
LLRRTTLTSQVVDYILGQIKSGQVKPGERLPTETELTQKLGISRTCVREAMKSLESLGLVRIRQRVGATVLEPSPSSLLNSEHFSLMVQSQQAEDLLEFRKIIEVGLASLAAEKARDEDIGAMRAALDKYRAELAGKSVDCNTDMSFHTALAVASGNKMAVIVWQMLSERLAQVLERTISVPNVCEETLKDHENIFRAVKSRNARKAREAMRAHLENAERNWRVAFRSLNHGHSGAARRTNARTPTATPK